MTLKMLKGKIHRATVVQAELDYVGSITVDQALLDAERTAQLLCSLLRGEHLEHARAMRSAMGKELQQEQRGYNVMVGALAGLLAQMQSA